jgi:hypothetical protein
MPSLADKRPVGFVPLGVFFFFGATMATFAAATLAIPGTVLDQAWKLNPAGHAGLAPFGRVMALPFLFLALALLAAGIGWLRCRSWGWGLGVSLIAVNLAGDVFNLVARGEWVKGAVGGAIAGLLLIYMTRSSVRNYFHPLRKAPETTVS